MIQTDTYHERELLLRVSEGEEKAFEELFILYSGLLHGFILKYHDDPQVADDILQDTFTKIWLTREGLAEVHHFTNYLFTIAKNYAMNLVRLKIREKRRHEDWYQSLPEETDIAGRELLFTAVDEAIERLPEQQRKTWIMSRREGKKYTDIARELGVSRETVKTNLRYANAGIVRYVLATIDLATLLLLIKTL